MLLISVVRIRDLSEFRETVARAQQYYRTELSKSRDHVSTKIFNGK